MRFAARLSFTCLIHKPVDRYCATGSVCVILRPRRRREHAEPGTSYLLAVSEPSRSQFTNCFASGLFPSSDEVLLLRERSMSSRAWSEEDLMPWTRSLNSSAFVAPFSASSYVISPREYRSNRDWSKVCIPYCEVPCAIDSRIPAVF